ncbi:MAG: histone deacetylase family protein [Oscillochloris sp.]|nr:histone deacetylase family protein [Oscillochloris sp.]
MEIIANAEHQLHDPPFEILDGVLTPYYESPRRVQSILSAIDRASLPVPRAPRRFGLGPILGVHAEDYVTYLQQAHARWVISGRPAESVFPSAMAPQGIAGPSSSPSALAGRYCFDLSAPITSGTYAAARGSVDTALTGASLLLEGARAAYVICRPPGHHATRNQAGGYCYFNNAAIAAHMLAHAGEASTAADEPTTTWGMRPPVVAVLDIDVHHGNGTQAIFYERSDVFVVSLHGDPDREYPYFSGFADERGAGTGTGYNLNLPLAAGTDDAGYLAALDQALSAIAAYSPHYLVVSAGFDTYIDDPLGDLAVTTGGFARIGAHIAGLKLPTLFVQEGGYAIEQLGINVVSLLQGFMNA